MKLLMEPIGMACCEGRPSSVQWRGKRYPVLEILECWKYRGKWWMDVTLQGDIRTYYRLQCRQACFEVFERNHEWVLSRLVD